MKLKNFKFNGPLFIGLVLAATLVSCHNDKIRKDAEKRDEVKQYFNSVPEVQIDDVFNRPNEDIEEEFEVDRIQKTR